MNRANELPHLAKKTQRKLLNLAPNIYGFNLILTAEIIECNNSNDKKYMPSNKYRFQLILDSDSILISQSPKQNKSRVLLANLDENTLLQLALGMINADLSDEFIEILKREKGRESTKVCL